jgi:hypothetical protein
MLINNYFNFKQAWQFTATGVIRTDIRLSGDKNLRFAVENVGVGNTVLVKGKLLSQASYATLTTLTGSTTGTNVDVSGVDLVEIEVTVYSASGGTPKLVASGFFNQPALRGQNGVFVSKQGNDSTGNGTQQNPYLTIGAAQDSITDATTTKEYIIYIGPGQYNELATYKIKPYIGLYGVSPELTTVKRVDNSAIQFDAATTATTRFTVQNVRFFNSVSVDRTGGTAGVNIDLFEVRIDGNFLWNGIGPGKDFSGIRSCRFGSVTGNAIVHSISASIIDGALTMGTTGSSNPLSGFECYPYIEGTYMLNVVLTADTGTQMFGEFTRNYVASTWSNTSAGTGTITAIADAVSLPQAAASLTTSGTVTIDLFTRAQSIGYVPATPANWTDTDPTKVSQAIDRLAAAVAGLLGGSIP